MEKTKVEEMMEEVNDWNIEDLRELAEQCNDLANVLEEEREGEK